MPRISTIDPKSGAETVTYVHEKQSNNRIQLVAEDDVRDARGRLLQKGRTLRADFVSGKFSTNIPEYIQLLEDSIAYRTGKIERLDVLQARANEQLLQNMMDAIDKNPELASKLRSKLTSKQIADKRKAAAAGPVVTPGAVKALVEQESEEDDAIDMYEE